MKALSIALKQAKNMPTTTDPFIVLLELDKRGWYRLYYTGLNSPFHEEAQLTCSGETARILFVEPETSTTGSLIIAPITRADGVYPANATMTDNKGGSGRVAKSLDTNAAPGMTFYLARNLEDVNVFDNTYLAFPFIVTQATTGQDLIPSVDLTIANPDRLAEAWARKADGFIGCTVRLKIIWAGDLD